MRDAALDWPTRLSGQIALQVGRDPLLVQTIPQEQMNALLLKVAERLGPPSADDLGAYVSTTRVRIGIFSTPQRWEVPSRLLGPRSSGASLPRPRS